MRNGKKRVRKRSKHPRAGLVHRPANQAQSVASVGESECCGILQGSVSREQQVERREAKPAARIGGAAMRIRTWQGLAALAAALFLWWISGKPELHVSVGEHRQYGTGTMALSSLIPERPEKVDAQIQVAVDELVEPIDAAPMFQVPLGIQLRGPRDVMVGDMVDLTTEITGAPTDFKWTVEPQTDGLRVLDGGNRAVFSNREVGDYVLFVSVAGQGGQVAHATKIITILPQPPDNPITASTLPLAAPQVDVSDLVRRWVAEVGHASKGETLAVADTFRQAANLLRGGVVGSDPLRDVESATEIAIGPNAAQPWLGTFFVRMREFLVPLNSTGNLQTPDQYANSFENFAAMLEAVAASQ